MHTDLKSKRIKIYSALEVANICGVVNQTAINWIRNGYLKAFTTPGGQYRVYKDDLVAFIRERGMRVPAEFVDGEASEADWKTVLVVDDDEVLNKAIASYFTKHLDGFTILQALNGFDAGSLIAQKKPGFIILDLDLPGVNGKKICQRIKKDSVFGTPYVIVVTGLEEDGIEQTMIGLGADRFFRKPLTLSTLVDAVNSAIHVE